MKEPKKPRIVIIDTLSHSDQKRAGIFKNILVTDYDSPEGTVREYYRNKKVPEYKILKTKEPVNVIFSHSMIEDMDMLDDYYVGE